MNYITISIDPDDLSRHRAVPVADAVSHSIAVSPMPELHWHRITALGFGYEKDKDNPNANAEEKLLDYAASLFASCRHPFSLLCERKGSEIVFAVGFQDQTFATGILTSAFGTAKTEPYIPQLSGASGIYAHRFEAVRTTTDELEKRDPLSAIHTATWADAVAKALSRHPGMVRLDFQPVGSDDCSKLLQEAQALCDRISTYLECNTQVSDNNSKVIKDDIPTKIRQFPSEVIKDNKSMSVSLSWKPVNTELSNLKKEAEYFMRLFSNSQKQGWTVEMTVSADLGTGQLTSTEQLSRENALIVPLNTMLTHAGYACKWDRYIAETIPKSQHRAILLPASHVTELISLPTTSFCGFERLNNRYYNVNLPHSDQAMPFAPLIQYEQKTDIQMFLPYKEMNRHCFVCGMTGSGKTNTVHHLLSRIGNFPYLVIEPVKGEYHSLPGVTSYTMTAGSTKALRINPFWFPQGTSLQFHMGCLKQIISSAFDLYAAMPNILEQSLVRVYQHCGWDFIQNTNRFASELPEQMLYPTFSDLCAEVKAYIDQSDYSEDLKGDYRGALLSRLQSFTSGPKGALLNTGAHLPCEQIHQGQVVISLDSLAEDADKAIVMGVIIAQYYEYLKRQCVGTKHKDLRHIVVIEEAHHLFAADASAGSSSAEGGSGANASQELVKTLNNMLAEIRAYGEGFIIVDQSPSALHPSVLKNTGVKIAHRVDYGKDIESMQVTLLLDKNDHELATLQQGQALVHYGGMRTSAKVWVPICQGKEDAETLQEEVITGSSITSTLLEDELLSTDVRLNIVNRVINQLLYDSLEETEKFYFSLCYALETMLLTYGYAELVEQIPPGQFLTEYITALIPEYFTELFPSQYCTCKMFCMFAERFLSMISETNGLLSPGEKAAFDSYRTQKLAPRLRLFFKYTSSKQYQRPIQAISNPANLRLLCDLVNDLRYNNVGLDDSERFMNSLTELLDNQYFLYTPTWASRIITEVARLMRRTQGGDFSC